MNKTTILSVLILSLVSMIATVPAFADSAVLYDNTTVTSGTSNAVCIGSTYRMVYGVGDSFTLSQNATVTGADFLVWVYSGDTMTNVDWSISTDPFSGYLATGPDTIVSGVYVGYPPGYSSKFDVYEESISIPSLTLAAGPYWFELQNAVSAEGGLVYWDDSNGPSTMVWSNNGTYEFLGPSSTFQILGNEESPVPEPSSFLLLGSGLAWLAGLINRKLMV